MEESSYVLSLKHSLWNVLAGSRGGITRIHIVELLRDRPYNVNQLHDKLKMDYKTIQHHIKVLLDENIITTTDKKKYGSMYFLTELLEKNISLFDEILEKTGNKELKKGDKNKE
jgi:DNA-binding transcriptional ArsR family regulator